MHDYDGFLGGMHLIWWFIWIAFLIWVFLIPTQWGKRTKREEPLDILKKRFARGEISKEQFGEQKKLLESDK